MQAYRQSSFVACFTIVGLFWFGGCADTSSYDVIIEKGTIIDGTGNQSYQGDVGIRDGIIAGIGNLSNAIADKRINAKGLIVAPGFIDAHSHSDQGMTRLKLRANENYIRQGVTTCIFGVDGRATPDSIKQQIETFERQGVGTNYAFYVGHNTIRREVMGMENRKPTAKELERMKVMVKQGMQLGALGLSTGLMYLPGRFSTTEEVIELAKVVAPYDGVFDSHVRDPVRDFIGSVKECIEIGEKAGVRPHPAHHKAVGKKNWGKSKEASELIQAAIDRGLDVTVDLYPYDGAATSRLMDVLVPLERQSREEILDALRDPQKREAIRERTENPPPDVFSWVETVGYESFRIEKSEKFPEYIGKMVVDIASEKSVNPFSLIVEIVLEEGASTGITLGGLSEDDVRFILTRPWTMIGSDGSTGWHNHPRSYGTFTRVLGRYVREWKVLSLEVAVHKMTALTADYFKLKGLGQIKKRYHADITVFDPETVIDHSDWIHPMRLSEGIIHVLVNGMFTLENEEMTENLNGRFIPFNGGKYIKKTKD